MVGSPCKNGSISSTRKLVDLASAVRHVQTKVPSIVTFVFWELTRAEKPQTCSMKNSEQHLPICGFFFSRPSCKDAECENLRIQHVEWKIHHSNSRMYCRCLFWGKPGRVIFVASEIPIGSQRLGSQLPNSHPTCYIIVIRDQRTPYNNRPPPRQGENGAFLYTHLKLSNVCWMRNPFHVQRSCQNADVLQVSCSETVDRYCWIFTSWNGVHPKISSKEPMFKIRPSRGHAPPG